MNQRRRIIIIALSTLPVIVLLIAAIIYLMTQARSVTRQLDVLLVDEIERQTNRAVTIGSVEVSPLGIATIRDLRIANGDSFDAGTLLSAERVIVRYNWFHLIRGRVAPIQSVESVRLISPEILLERFRTGRLNIQDLLTPKPGPPRPPFKGTVRITNGRLVFRDWLARVPRPKPIVTRIVDLDATFDAAQAPLYVYNVSGRGAEGKLVDRLSLSGSIDNQTGRLSLDLVADNAAAAHWSRYFFMPGAVNVRQGRADLRLSATRRITDGRKVWRYIGQAKIRNGSADVVRFRRPATNVTGTIAFANDVADLDISASMVGTAFKVTGKVVDFSAPRLDLKVASRSADFQRLLEAAEAPETLRQVRMIGRGPVTIDILGPTDNLAYTVSGSIPAVLAEGYRASDLTVRATYAAKTVDVESASARALDGALRLSGAIVIGKETARLLLSGTASGIQLAEIAQLQTAGVRGRAAGRFSLSGTLERPRLEANVQVPSGILDNTRFTGATASVLVTSDLVRIRSLSANAAGGAVRLSGDIVDSRLDLQIAAAGVDLRRLLEPFNLTGYAGTANLQGRISGSFSNPVLVANAEIFEGSFRTFQFDYARGQLVASRDLVTLEDAIVRVLPAEIVVRGRITGPTTRAPRFELDVEVAQAPAATILSILRTQADVTGTISGRLSIRGSAPNLVAEGTLTLTDGSVSGYPVTSAQAQVTYSEGTLRLADLTARSDEATFTATGSIDRSGNLAFTFSASRVSLARLREITSPYAVLSGEADLTGRISGTTQRPNVAARIVSERPTINTVQFDAVSVGVAWTGEVMALSDMVLDRGEGRISIDSVVYDTDAGTLVVEDGALTEFSFPALYTVAINSPYISSAEAEGLRDLLSRLRRPDTGVITASFSASGPVESLEARLSLSAREVDIAEIEDVRLDLAVVSRRGLVVLEEFEASSDVLNVTARGTLVENGRTDLEVDAYNLDLAALIPATGPTPVTGAATLRASIRGPVRSPQVDMSVELVEPVVYGLEFDRLRASQITINGGWIEISRAIVTRDDHSAAFYGTIPWNWQTLSVPTDRPIDLRASVEEQTLGILGVLTDAITVDEREPGTFSANLDVTGTLSSPDLNGRLTIADGKMRIRKIETGFTGLQADLVFDQDLITVERLTGRSSAGGTFQVEPGGSVSIANLIRPVEGQAEGIVALVLRADQLAITEQDLFGYRERVSGKFTTAEDGISVTGALMQPRIAGSIQISDAIVILSPLPVGPAPRPPAPAFNPAFDLSFVLRDDVWFRNPNIKALLQGEGRIAGSLGRPEIAADFTVASGQIDLPTQKMRITRGTINVSWIPPEPARVAVDMRAQTSVTATSPTGERRRYTIVMTVHGSLENLRPQDIDLRSEPPGLPRDRILAALGHFEDIYGGGELALSQQLSDLFTVALSPLVLGRLGEAFVEAFGLEEFNIEYGFEQPLAVFISRQLFDGFHVSYWRIVTGASTLTGATYTLRLSYRVREWFELGWVTDSRRVNIIEAAYTRRY
ncbi:MAG: translocation/assembly module TamB domain-containing protein [Armatimonadetes bacterium]|nr:translocation/assembly module TamB domain-containing protein [Armatimonadota bacterium]